jgi:hypothetical protein
MKYSFFVFKLIFIISFGCNTESRFDDVVQFELLDSIIRTLEVELLPLEKEISKLATYSSLLYDKKDSLIFVAEKGKYIQDRHYWFYNPNLEKKESTVFISLMASNPEKAVEEVYLTEPLDSEFMSIVRKYPMVTQVYYNTGSQISRVYPPYDLVNTIDPDIDVKAFNFYYLGDEVHNPERNHVWVEEIYIDPAGRGWILSIIHPVYFNNEFKGVLGMDITLADLMQYFLAKFDESLVIIDKDGTIVAGSSNAIEALSMPPLKNHTYVQTILSDNFRKEDFNLFKSKSKEVRQMASKFLLEKEGSFEFNLEGYDYKAFCRKMNLLNWHLLNLQH